MAEPAPGAGPLVAEALAEDLGLTGRDPTAEATVPAAAQASARIVAKQAGTICGLGYVREAFRQVDAALAVTPHLADGTAAAAGSVLAEIGGPARSILAGERVALNFLGQLSGVATATARAVEAAGGRCAICDTRKTVPGLRAAQKYAVRCGGGVNHRFALDDGLLVKDNHHAAAGGVGRATTAALAAAGHMRRVQVEVATLEELDAALAAGADCLLLDNMDAATLTAAVERAAGRATLEASGGLDLAALPAVAASGVDVISLGWLTQGAPPLDVALDLGS